MRIRSRTGSVVTCLWLSLGVVSAWADIELTVVSTAPGRAHFVGPGLATTFVVSTRNTALIPVTVTLKIQGSGVAGEWPARLFEADTLFRAMGVGSPQLEVTVPALRSVRVLAQLAAGSTFPEGAEGVAMVTAWRLGTVKASLDLHARVRNRPKIYYVAIDGCGRRYLDLARNGREPEHRWRGAFRPARHFDVVRRRAGTLGNARRRRRLREQALGTRRVHDPVGKHTAALPAERRDQYRGRLAGRSRWRWHRGAHESSSARVAKALTPAMNRSHAAGAAMTSVR